MGKAKEGGEEETEDCSPTTSVDAERSRTLDSVESNLCATCYMQPLTKLFFVQLIADAIHTGDEAIGSNLTHLLWQPSNRAECGYPTSMRRVLCYVKWSSACIIRSNEAGFCYLSTNNGENNTS